MNEASPEVVILQAWIPSLKNQEELKKVLAIYNAFAFLDPGRIEKYAGICREISTLHDHGEANITINIRDGDFQNEEYGKRIKKYWKSWQRKNNVLV